ncbi:asparagine synthase-related protein [Novosphingobium sp. BL-52-GroH]|uniref:asparagine synthase-related protein n=1 Tax=Novosphingobium sp. BL-52-GroH TaxID=3349877 RepID=UPI003850B502
MRSFFAIARSDGLEPEWVARSTRQANAKGLDVVFQSDRLLVAASGVEWCAVPQGDGILIGDLYFRHGPARVYSGADADLDLFVSAYRDGAVSERCWGSFLSIRDKGTSETEFLHSPMSSLCVFYAVQGNTVLIASDARSLCDLTGAQPKIDWQALGTHLVIDDLSFARTCVQAIRELRCGETLRITPDNAPHVFPNWNAWTYAHPDIAITEREQASELLEREIIRCATARLRDLDEPLLDLSGGLDSSVLAAMCSRNAIVPKAANFFSPQTEGDERRFAQMVVQHLAMPLAEVPLQPDHVNIAGCALPHLPRPYARAYLQTIDRITLASAPGARAFVNGGGGDAVFCHLQTSAPAVDAMLDGNSFLRTVSEVAHSARCSFWIALRMSITKLAKRSQEVNLRRERDFVRRDFETCDVNDLELPWQAPPQEIRVGKLEQVYGLYMSARSTNCFSRSITLKGIFPLLSQPLVEACLRMPSWLWVGRGNNRVLARELASKWLPDEVAWRVSKGGPGQLQRDLFLGNRAVIREMLMDGNLQKHGILDRSELEGHLSPAGQWHSDKIGRLLRLCYFEGWANQWVR